MIDEGSKGNNMENLKQAVIENLQRRQQKYPDDVLLIAGKGYTQAQALKEIETDTPLGEGLVIDMVLLTIDLLGRNKTKATSKLKSFKITVWVTTQKNDWWASCEYQHPDNQTIETITTIQTAQPSATVAPAINTILAEAKRLGIGFVPYYSSETKPLLLLDNDEDASGIIGDGWRQLIRDEAARIGFRCCYDEAEPWYPEGGGVGPERVAVDDDDEEFLNM